LDAVPRHTAPGREQRVTTTWEAELLRVIELDPHAVEQHFQTLAQALTEILRHVGIPFAPAKDQSVPLSLAQAA
jgi:hypothetical protein